MNSTLKDEIERFITVPGGKVWYKIFNKNLNAIPLLLIHGGPGGTHDCFESLIPVSRERPLIIYDQLGGGNSDKPKNQKLWVLDRFVEELSILIKKLDLKRVHILGHSWGTMLAVNYILSEGSKKVASLILSGPYLSTKIWIADQQNHLNNFPKNFKSVIKLYENSGHFQSTEYQSAMVTYYKRHFMRKNPWPECLRRSFEKMGLPVYEYMWGPSEFTMRGTLKDQDVTERLKEIKVPVLFTCGQYDEASPETTTYFQSLIKGSQICIFKGASHLHFLEKKRKFIKTIKHFMHSTEKSISSG